MKWSYKRRFAKLNFWNKVGFLGSIASLFGLFFAFYSMIDLNQSSKHYIDIAKSNMQSENYERMLIHSSKAYEIEPNSNEVIYFLAIAHAAHNTEEHSKLGLSVLEDNLIILDSRNQWIYGLLLAMNSRYKDAYSIFNRLELKDIPYTSFHSIVDSYIVSAREVNNRKNNSLIKTIIKLNNKSTSILGYENSTISYKVDPLVDDIDNDGKYLISIKNPFTMESIHWNYARFLSGSHLLDYCINITDNSTCSIQGIRLVNRSLRFSLGYIGSVKIKKLKNYFYNYFSFLNSNLSTLDNISVHLNNLKSNKRLVSLFIEKNKLDDNNDWVSLLEFIEAKENQLIASKSAVQKN